MHRQFSETTAVLAGDSLIVGAFTTLTSQADVDARRACSLVAHLANYTGFPNGICAGQAWEDEAAIDLKSYHLSKTGALFIAATQMGAIAAGHDPDPWQELGARIGQAFQIADDLMDVVCARIRIWVSLSGQDAKNNRPNAVSEHTVLTVPNRLLNDILGGAQLRRSHPVQARLSLAKMVQLQSSRLMSVNRQPTHSLIHD